MLQVLVFKMSDTGKQHADAGCICCFNNFIVTNRSARLNDGACTGGHQGFDTVFKGKKCVGGNCRSLKRQTRILCFLYGNAGCVHPGHLARANPQGLCGIAKDYGIGLYMLNDLPGEFKGSPFIRRWWTFCGNFELGLV